MTINNKTLTQSEDKSVEIPKDNMYPVDLLKPNSGIAGMSVKWQNAQSAKAKSEDFYALRWETLGKSRFYKKPEKPVSPTIMKLYRIAKEK